jgi:hypothetical protein
MSQGHSKGTLIRSTRLHSLWTAFSPDGKHIVSGPSDKTMRVWDAEIGGVLSGLFKGHTGTIYSVGFSPDGKHIVSSSQDKVQKFEMGDLTSRSLSSTNLIDSVVFSPNGKLRLVRRHTPCLMYLIIVIPRKVHLPRDSSTMERGWILNSASELAFWVPPWNRTGLWWPRSTGGNFEPTKLDLSQFVHGDSWQQCGIITTPALELTV